MWPGSIERWVNVRAVGDKAAAVPLGEKFGDRVEDVLIDNGHRAHAPEPYLNAGGDRRGDRRRAGLSEDAVERHPWSAAAVAWSAGKNDSMASSATVMSTAVPNVARVLKNAAPPLGPQLEGHEQHRRRRRRRPSTSTTPGYSRSSS